MNGNRASILYRLRWSGLGRLPLRWLRGPGGRLCGRFGGRGDDFAVASVPLGAIDSVKMFGSFIICY
jgi:hypothetical protein